RLPIGPRGRPRRTWGLSNSHSVARFGHGVAEITQSVIAQRWHGVGCFGPPSWSGGGRLLARPRFRLDLTNRLLQRQTLAGNIGLIERRLHAPQLRQKRGTRALIKRPAILAGVLLKAADGA